MLLAIAIPIGLTLGAATWALMRGRGKGSGLLLHIVFAIIGSFIGGLAAQAIVHPPTPLAVGIGAVVGGFLAAVIEAVAFGQRPKHVAFADRAGLGSSPPPAGGAPAKRAR
jgi:hypothetical protein